MVIFENFKSYRIKSWFLTSITAHLYLPNYSVNKIDEFGQGWSWKKKTEFNNRSMQIPVVHPVYTSNINVQCALRVWCDASTLEEIPKCRMSIYIGCRVFAINSLQCTTASGYWNAFRCKCFTRWWYTATALRFRSLWYIGSEIISSISLSAIRAQPRFIIILLWRGKK